MQLGDMVSTFVRSRIPKLFMCSTYIYLLLQAGNAMSLTVVCATMLAAMTCKQLRLEHKASLSNSSDIMATLQSMNEATALSKKPEASPIDGNTTDIKFLFDSLSKMAEAAMKSSIMCSKFRADHMMF